MARRTVFPTLATAALALAAGSAHAPGAQAAIVTVSGTDVTGVTGVFYNGTLYDATFVSGAASTVYPGSGKVGNDAPYSLTFSTQADAFGISNALASAVDFSSYMNGGDTFGGASTFNYETDTSDKPQVASQSYSIDLLTPFTSDVQSADLSVQSNTNPNAFPYQTSVGLTNFDPGQVPDYAAYVVWTAEAATDVPEPGSLALAGGGLAAAAAVRRRRRRG